MNYFKMRLLELLSQNLPEIMMSTKISMNGITKDTEVIASFQDDILLLSALTLRLVKALMDITMPLKAKNLVVGVPVLVIAGEKDLICEFNFTLELYNKIIAPDKRFHTFPEGLHSPHTDFEYEEWLDSIEHWAENKLRTFTPNSHQNFKGLKVIPG